MDSDQEVIEQPINQSSLQVSPETVRLDIFQHMRIGIKNTNYNCLCENNLENLYYCIPCKVSCCTKCTLPEHASHLLIQKEKYTLKPPQIDGSFSAIENILESEELFQNLQERRKELLNEIDMTCKKINALVDEWKEKKYKEINELFDDLTNNIQDLNEKN